MGEHVDSRGTIRDLLGPIDSVTMIITVPGAVRGNHVHYETIQWTLVVSGCLQIVESSGPETKMEYLYAGDMAEHLPGVAHAWKAIGDEDTVCFVFTRGPRSGEGYETDTYRLDEPLLS